MSEAEKAAKEFKFLKPQPVTKKRRK